MLQQTNIMKFPQHNDSALQVKTSELHIVLKKKKRQENSFRSFLLNFLSRKSLLFTEGIFFKGKNVMAEFYAYKKKDH